MTTKQEGIARLGRAIRSRRIQLGLTQDVVAKIGGPSDVTLRNIESGRAKRVNVATLGKLDRALDWSAGTAEGILDGFFEVKSSSPVKPVMLHEATDSQLLLEVSRRLAERESPRESADPNAAPSDQRPRVAREPERDGAIEAPPEHTWGLAAHSGTSRRAAMDAEAARAGEESQDPEDWA